jgi:hypothetical protein
MIDLEAHTGALPALAISTQSSPENCCPLLLPLLLLQGQLPGSVV